MANPPKPPVKHTSKTGQSEEAAPRAQAAVAQPAQNDVGDRIFGTGPLSTVVKALLGVIIGFLAGDLLLKQNLEAYLKEEAAINEAIDKANQDFESLATGIDDLFADRLFAIEQMNGQASASQFIRYIELYQIYYESVQNWNRRKGAIQERIRRLTNCSGLPPDSAVAQLVRTRFLDPLWSINADPAFKDADQVSGREFSGRKPDRYCPDVMLFDLRPDLKEQDGSKPFVSAFEALRYIHWLLVDNTRRNIVTCHFAARQIRERKLADCQAKDLGLAGEERGKAVSTCVRDAIIAYAAPKICPTDRYQEARADGSQEKGELGDVASRRITTVRYRIAIALEMLNQFREPHLIAACEEAKGFWSTLQNVDCRGRVAVRKARPATAGP
jgi:hypothetical protein